MSNGTTITLGVAGALAAAAVLSDRADGSRALDVSELNYGGMTLTLPTASAERIEYAMEQFGFHDRGIAPGAKELRRLVHDLRDQGRREARRVRTKAATAKAEKLVDDSEPLLELAQALESVESIRIPGTARQSRVNRGDGVTNKVRRNLYFIQPGETWVVESVGGHPAKVRLIKLDKLSRRTSKEGELALKSVEGLIDGGALEHTLGLK